VRGVQGPGGGIAHTYEASGSPTPVIGTKTPCTHLVYGEWLRRANRRIAGRVELRRARDAFTIMGVQGFADRARRELLATGENVRKRSSSVRASLTAQEGCIVRLAVRAEARQFAALAPARTLRGRRVQLRWYVGRRRLSRSAMGVDQHRRIPSTT
jgi:hypothetical protein